MITMKVCALVFIAVIGCTAAASDKPMVVKDMPIGKDIQGRIINGYPAYEGKVPYVVGLGFKGSNGGWWCGGSIIDHTWVLTAAHCTNDAESVTIYYGATWRLQPQYTHWVGRNDFVQHHAYDTSTINNDIALIRTPHVDFWSLVDKVELPSYNDRYNNYYGWWGVLSGWGKTSNNGGVTDYLNCVDIQIADNSICEAHYGTTVITPNHVCIATPENKGSCSGDSGGPLVLHDGNRQVAIVSFGSSVGCEANAPKGMTRVTSYLDWIRDNTGISY